MEFVTKDLRDYGEDRFPEASSHGMEFGLYTGRDAFSLVARGLGNVRRFEWIDVVRRVGYFVEKTRGLRTVNGNGRFVDRGNDIAVLIEYEGNLMFSLNSTDGFHNRGIRTM